MALAILFLLAGAPATKVAPAKPAAPTIAVLPFYDGAVKSVWMPYFRGRQIWVIGRGVTDMLIAALAKEAKRTGAFRVVEREQLDKILAEQKLATTGVIDPATAARFGRILGAQLVLTGSVTELSIETKRITLPKKWGLSGWLSEARSSLDARLVDVETAEVLSGLTASGFDSRFGVRVTRGELARFSFGSENFEATILGKAVREAVNSLARKVTADILDGVYARRLLPQRTGKVAYAKGGKVVINLGLRHGVRKGDKFTVYRVLEVIKDPDTGEVLTELRKIVGRIVVEKVELKASWCRPLEGEEFQVGDKVRFSGEE